MSIRKIEGLALLQAQPPFDDYFATILDLRGPWTAAMLEIGGDLPPRAGLWVWEGSCEVDEREGDPDADYVFDGAWRALSEGEALMLVHGQRPLTDDPFPALEHLDKL